MTKLKDQFYNIVTTESADAADILIYGYIGQQAYWWEDNKEKEITDLALAKEINRLEQLYNRINIRINSPGGSIFHGNAIINAIRNSKAEIHTYNDGLAASMAALIWLAADHRHMPSNSLLMIHAPATGLFGNAADLMEGIDLLDKFETTLVATISKSTGLSSADIKKDFFDDFKDHWLTAEDCVSKGIINQIDEYEIEGTPQNLRSMDARALMKSFQKEAPQSSGLFQRLSAYFNHKPTVPAKETVPNIQSQTDIEMKKDDLKKSLENGDLSAEDLTALMQEQGFTVTAPAPPPAADPVDEDTPPASNELNPETVTAAVQKALQPFTQQLKDLENKVAQYGKLPGDQRTDDFANADNHQQLTDEEVQARKNQEAYHQEANRMAKSAANPFSGHLLN